jgi:hypothetical protein
METEMPRTLADLRAAGAVQAIARKYRQCKCWQETLEWASREFRDASHQSCKAACERAKKAVNLADRITKADPDEIFDAAKERRLQA